MTKFDTYLALLPTVQDSDGFIESAQCDSLLFTALVGCVPRVNVNIDAAFDGKLWHRRPCDRPCYPQHSKSTISRDMIVGLLWYAWCNGRLDISESIVKHALSNWGVMGKGVLSRTLISPSLLSTAAWVSYQLGGPSRSLLRAIPVTGGIKTDFEAHLHVLHLALRSRLTGSRGHDSTLAEYADRNRNNALFQIAAGRTTEGARILNDALLFPETRLPTASDRKTPWLWERDYGLDWRQSNSSKVHSGGDYLFAYSLAAELI